MGESSQQQFSLFFSRLWAMILSFRLTDLLDVLLVALIIYGLIRLMRQTRSVQLLKGLFWLLLAYAATTVLNLNATRVLFDQLFNSFVLLMLVLFQPEIRSLFENVGRSNVSNFRFFSAKGQAALEQEEVAGAIHHSCEALGDFSETKTGALLVFERQTMLGEIVKTGTDLDAKVSRQLVGNLFFPKSPLHDGAAVVRKGRLVAAGCFLPLTHNQDLDPLLGTRHRAAVGMSEQSDALIAVVSEETGQISCAYKGKLTRDLAWEELEDMLRQVFLDPEDGVRRFNPRRIFGGKRRDPHA
ncbi:MAG: diadenylate cyclase CdaA [Oscillospiraceae bacterium]|nr:diadenylate cyclase CdaA [Oscillospiraceae bacterium]